MEQAQGEGSRWLLGADNGLWLTTRKRTEPQSYNLKDLNSPTVSELGREQSQMRTNHWVTARFCLEILSREHSHRMPGLGQMVSVRSQML